MRARALVVTYSDTASALRILTHVQELRPGLPVVVRTYEDTDIDRLKALISDLGGRGSQALAAADAIWG